MSNPLQQILFEELAFIQRDFPVTSADVLGRSRSRTVVRARQALYRRLRARGLSYPEVGKLVDRDHTTVLAACRQHRPMTQEP